MADVPLTNYDAISDARKLTRILGSWTQLNALDDLWSHGHDAIAAGYLGSARNPYADLDHVLRDMQRILERMPAAVRTALDLLEGNYRWLDERLTVTQRPEMGEEGSQDWEDEGALILAFRDQLGELQPSAVLRRSLNQLSRRSGELTIAYRAKRAELRANQIPEKDLPPDVKCALVFAIGVLGVFVGLPLYWCLAPAFVAMLQMGCFDDLGDMTD